ncbi:MAG: tsf [Ignavibacteria bacterium]|nr:tsf [Ignavibacteria bacterium]
MIEITPSLVKELREITGAGMGDCKSALTQAEGDMQKAIEILRKKGAASAAKRADRAAKEGIITIRTNENSTKAVIVEVNSETDFVARNEKFEAYVHAVAQALMESGAATADELMSVKVGNDTIQGMHNEILTKFSENINVRKFEHLNTTGYLADYIHAGSKLGVLVEFSESGLNDAAKSLCRDIAMQVAAMNPQFVDRSIITETQIAKEIEIYRQQAIDQGKKEDIAERIATGKLDKFYQEQCLIEQTFVKDGNKTITDVLREISAQAGKEVKILSFRRYFLGETE